MCDRIILEAYMNDVVIIGAGPSGLFAAYELITKNKQLKITIIDKGSFAEKRYCPMKDGKACQNCNPCNILSGYGGAGTFSDGKLNFIPKLGKSDLFKYMSEKEAYDLINDTEKIFNLFNMDYETFPINLEEDNKWKKEIALKGAKLLVIKQKHLRSNTLPKHIINFTKYLKDNVVEVITNGDV